ncbi:MAG: hypothetical protein WBF42_02405, partial [Terracidiphilus sp.]
MAHGVCSACGGPGVSTGSTGGNSGFKVAVTGLIVYAMLCIVAITFFGSRVGRWIRTTRTSQVQHRKVWQPHNGPVARLDELKGSGTIYLVQMGGHADQYSLDDFAQWLRATYKLDVKVLAPMEIDKSAWNPQRGQWTAELLAAQIRRDHPELAADPSAYLIGFIDSDMYSTQYMWRSPFTWRDSERVAMISANGMEDSLVEARGKSAQAVQEDYHARLRRILLKDVAIVYWHLPVNDDATSLLHNTLDPDLPTESIYESDIDPARSAGGLDLGGGDPCLFFDYSPRRGIQRMPGQVIRGCGDIQDPEEKEGVERFEVDLHYSLLIDKRTDFYLADTIPIAFQRVTRDGWKGVNPFGISGSDNYDAYLSSADNIRIVRADGG